MTSPAIPDIITVVGSAYQQPIADLLQRLLQHPTSRSGPGGIGQAENGYSASVVVLLIAMLESYTGRLRFVRRDERVANNLSTPDLLAAYFPTLPITDALREAFLCRNAVMHNHIWHLEVSDFENNGAQTLATPINLGFQTNKHYGEIVDIAARKTATLRLNVDPSAVDRSDARKVFEVVWATLKFMNSQNFGHTPLAGSTVRFRGKLRQFADLLDEITDAGEVDAG